MKNKKSLASIGYVLLAGVCFFVPAALVAASTLELDPAVNQRGPFSLPLIEKAVIKNAGFGKGDTAVVAVDVIGGTSAKSMVVACELHFSDKNGTDALVTRKAGELFELNAEERVSKNIECPIPQTIPASGDGYLKISLENYKNYEFASEIIPVNLKTDPSGISARDIVWQLEKWLPPSNGREPIRSMMNWYVLRTPKLIVPVNNDSGADTEVSVRTLTWKNDREQSGKVMETAGETVAAKSKKEITVSLDPIEDPGVYNVFIQLIDARTKRLLSSEYRASFIAKGAIGDSFMEIIDVNFDKRVYSKGDVLKGLVFFKGSDTYVKGSKDADIEFRLFSDSGSIGKPAIEAGTYKGTMPLILSTYNFEMPVTADISDPSAAVIIKKDGKTLSEFAIKGLPYVSKTVSDLKDHEETAPLTPDLNSYVRVGLVILILVLAGGLFYALRKRKKGGSGSSLSIIIITGAAAYLFGANAVFAYTPYVYDGETYWNVVPTGSWTSPVAGAVFKPGQSVTFKGTIDPFVAELIAEGVLRFYVSEDTNLPVYSCKGRRQCIDTTKGNKITLLGQVIQPPPYWMANPWAYNQTYVIPANINLSGPVRFWVEYTGWLAHWAPDCCDGSTTEHFDAWITSYQKGTILGNDARYVSQNVPAIMEAGVVYPVTVTMKNIGVKTWTVAGNYYLGSQNPTDNSTWSIKRVSVGGSVVADDSKTFTYNVTAPSVPGTYNFQWRMVQDGVEWFGDTTPNVAVQVIGNDADYVSQTVPATMTSGLVYPVSITMKNSGLHSWTVAGNYNLGSQNAPDNTTWGLGRVTVGSSIAAGASKTFSFNVTAPAPGNRNFQWRMVQDGVEWFGDLTPNIIVNVKTPVTIKGSVKDEKGAGIPGVALDLCASGSVITDAGGNWSKIVAAGDSYCVRISSGLPTGYNYIHGTNNTGCHANASTYEWQVAGQNQYANCTFNDQRSWDLASDNQLNFLISYCDCGAWGNLVCGTGGCGPLQRQQTRTCTPANCLAQSQCVNDATCCVCVAWLDDDCAKSGCAANQMHQTRTCNVAGCAIESQCVASASCPRTLTVSLTASPVSGPVPLAVVLTGMVGGTAIGTVNYTTWFDCNNTCATVAACFSACGAWDDKADGVVATTKTLNHTYAAAGTFHPKMIVERNSLVAEKTVAVSAINAPPTASALIKQIDYCGSGLATMFSWNYSDPENDPQTYRQVQVDNDGDFSSPVDDTGKVATASVSYVTLATKLAYNTTYHWRVKVWDDKGNSSNWVNGPDFSTPLHSYPVIGFDWIPTVLKATEAVVFTDSSQVFGGATVSSRSWVFEGATPNTSVAAQATVIYAVKGDYKATLTITDSNGYTCSLEKNMNVKSSLPDWEEL